MVLFGESESGVNNTGAEGNAAKKWKRSKAKKNSADELKLYRWEEFINLGI